MEIISCYYRPGKKDSPKMNCEARCSCIIKRWKLQKPAKQDGVE